MKLTPQKALLQCMFLCESDLLLINLLSLDW